MPDAPALVSRVAALLEYPDGAFHSAVADCCAAAIAIDPAASAGLRRFAAAVDGLSVEALQELYVSTFDHNPRCALDLGWHLFGEAYERGALLAMLREELQRAGIPERGELPDHLPSVLLLLDRLDPARRAELTRLLAPAVAALEAALEQSGNPYAALVKSAAALAALGG
jgi:nitrate reductase molybdenum cofactor assembly chaperone NarJ/NarW